MSLFSGKNEEHQIKIEGARVFTTLNIDLSDAQGQIPLGSVVLSGRNVYSLKTFIHVLITCKNEDDSIKLKELEWSKHVSLYKSMGIFPDAQGQLTPQSLVRSARMKKIRSKIKAPDCSQDYPIITLWELYVAMETRVLIQSGPKPNAAFPPPQ